MVGYKTISLYDSQRQNTNGKGYYTVNLRLDEPDLEAKIKKLRDDQKKKNAAYKKRGITTLSTSSESTPSGSSDEEPPPSKKKPTKKKPARKITKELTPFKKTKFKLLLDKDTGNTTFLLGSSKMGKSTALMEIYDTYYSSPEYISILWTGNPQIKLYKGHKRLLVSGVWDKKAEQVIESEKKIQTKTKNHYRFCNMFDDVIPIKNSALLDRLILTYRNSDMSSLISLQYSNLLSKCSRANCNNVLCFGFNTDESIEIVIKTFLTGYLRTKGINSIADQINWYKEVTADHSFIYIKPADGVVSFHKFSI